MRPLRHQTIVERTHREVDQSVGHPPLQIALVILARALGQRFKGGAHRSTTDLVEDALDEDDAIVGGGEGEASRLHSLNLFSNESFGVAGMPCMCAGVAELEDALLARLREKFVLIEAITQCSRGARNEGEMREPDLAHTERHPALADVLQLLADANPIGRGATRHVTVGLDPGDRAVEALLVVFVALRESGGDLGELEVDHVGGEGELGQPLGEISSTYTTPTPNRHSYIIRTFVWNSQALVRQDNWQGFRTRP